MIASSAVDAQLSQPIRSSGHGSQAVQRRCGACSLCCVVLRVDELRKLAGVSCIHQRAGDDSARAEGGCGIHATRPGICRAYRCLWLSGGLEEGDRPDRIGAVLDVVSRGVSLQLELREAQPGAFDRSARLREIAASYRRTMAVRITHSEDVMNPDRPYRVLLPDGEEQRVAGDRVDVLREGQRVERRRLPWLERVLRRIVLRARALRLRGYRGA